MKGETKRSYKQKKKLKKALPLYSAVIYLSIPNQEKICCDTGFNPVREYVFLFIDHYAII